MFLYKGNYFVTTFLPKEDEYMDSFPPLYYLDVKRIKMIKVEANKEMNSKGKFLSQKNDLIILSDDRGRIKSFFNRFEIIKQEDSYRLIKR